MVQTICVTGIGDNFSNCSSTIARVPSNGPLGNSMTWRKTSCGGNQATFNFGCHNELQDLAAARVDNDSPLTDFCSRANTKFPPLASNCQRRLASGASC